MKTRVPKTKIVTGCNDCPFSYFNMTGDKAFCAVDENTNELNVSNGMIITPTDCPLKTQSIIVTYES